MNSKIEDLTEKLEKYKNKIEKDKFSKKWEPMNVAFYEGLIKGLECVCRDSRGSKALVTK